VVEPPTPAIVFGSVGEAYVDQAGVHFRTPVIYEPTDALFTMGAMPRYDLDPA